MHFGMDNRNAPNMLSDSIMLIEQGFRTGKGVRAKLCASQVLHHPVLVDADSEICLRAPMVSGF